VAINVVSSSTSWITQDRRLSRSTVSLNVVLDVVGVQTLIAALGKCRLAGKILF